MPARKTSVSIPDSIFQAAERHRARTQMSRSRLYARAIEEYLVHYGEQAITEQLNEVYATEISTLDPAFYVLQIRSLPPERW